MATYKKAPKRAAVKSRKKATLGDVFTSVAVVCLAVILAFGAYALKGESIRTALTQLASGTAVSQAEPASVTPKPTERPGIFAPKATEAPAVEETPVVTPELTPAYVFEPHCVEGTEPANLIKYTEVMVNNESIGKLDYTLTDGSETGYDYVSPYGDIDFLSGDEYTDLEGVITFRGNNYRTGSAYGVTDTLSGKKFGSGWSVSTGSLTDYNGNSWSGSGWTGQPLVVRWPKETRAIMTSMYEDARNKDDLVEVIYATMDGYIYFIDLDTGENTRPRMKMGLTYKGAGALDPRGYPILYVGSGVRNMNGKSNVSIINLIDCSVMYTFGDKDKFALRDWPMFDSSPLVDAETDQLIYPGENGLLYIIHLNTKYDEKAGTLSIEPDNVVKWRYQSTRQTRYVYWLGMESSAATYGGYIFMCDNGGQMMCLDLNTLELVWVQDILDDSNSTPVIDVDEDGHPYIYVSTSFHYGWRSSTKATVPIFKLDGETGEILWQVDYECSTESGVSGGVQGSMAVDEKYIYAPVAKTGTANGGILVAIDKQTGEKAWEFASQIYSWGSPIRFNDAAGGRYIIYNTGYSSNGYLYLINADTGDVLDSKNLNGNIEASGVVFENKLVIGHRSCRIVGVELQ